MVTLQDYSVFTTATSNQKQQNDKFFHSGLLYDKSITQKYDGANKNMPKQIIPLSGSNQNTDEIALPDALGASVVNGYTSELNNLHQFPGYEEFVDTGVGFGVTGLYSWAAQDQLIATIGEKVFRITEDGTATDITGTGTPQLNGKMTWADFGTDDLLFAANGGQIIQIPNSGTTQFIADVDAPTTVSHVAVLNRKLLAKNGNDGRFDWSNADAPTTWSGSFATAEGAEDGLKGLYVADERIWLPGNRTTERWRDTGASDINNAFVAESQQYIQRGVASTYAPAYCLNTWYWLDEFGNIVRLLGNTPEVLPRQNPQGLTSFLQTFDFSDGVGHFLPIDGRYYYIVNFEKAKKSIYYDIQLDRWGELSYWNSLTAENNLFKGSVFAFFPEWNAVFMGDRQTGKIYKMSANLFTDDGALKRVVYRSAYMDRGSEDWKQSHRITGRMKRKNVTSDPGNLELMVRYRDDGEVQWHEQTIDMFDVNGYDIRWEVRQLGQYYARQYEFVVTADFELIFGQPVEHFSVSMF